MTATRSWLERRSARLRIRFIAAVAGLVMGVVFAVLGGGVLLARVGAYLIAPSLVLLSWALVVVPIVGGICLIPRRIGRTSPSALARVIEQERGMRHGSLIGVAERESGSGSAVLSELADRKAAAFLEESGDDALARTARWFNRSLGLGGASVVFGALLFVGAGPGGARSGQFWHPIATLLEGRGPIEISVDRSDVPFGDTVTVDLSAHGYRSLTFWMRPPGEPWASNEMSLDASGHASVVLGPLESDRFLRATSGGTSSSTLRVRIQPPVLLTSFRLMVRFPAHTGLPDEPLAAGPDTVRMPIGSRVMTSGSATVPLESAEWSTDREAIPLEVEAERFAGEFTVVRDGRWSLNVKTDNGGAVDQEAPVLNVVAVPDSAPVVTIPIPGSDSTVPSTLRRPLVVDAFDDFGLTEVQLVHWRVARGGEASDTIAERLPLHGDSPDRAVVQWLLDLSSGGFLPGDTAVFYARARDNARDPQYGESRVYRTWLPSLAELRDAVRSISDGIADDADSLLEEQRDLARAMEDLAAERERSEGSGRFESDPASEDLPFSAVERARELSSRQEEAVERTEQLREQLKELSEAAWSAGITDPALQGQLRELEDLLAQALSDELMQRLAALAEAIEQLDPEAMREALNQLANSAQGLEQQLSRGRELFERAAIEGKMETLAADAEDLAAEQREWNEDVPTGPSDSSLAARERELAEDTRGLADNLRALQESMARARTTGETIEPPTGGAETAASQMEEAAGHAALGERQNAQRSGQAASESIEPVAAALREQRSEVQEQWRREVLDAMDRALVETALLAESQNEVLHRLDLGESGTRLRGELAALRSGLDRIVLRLQGAAGRNALVSPQLGAALGFSRLRMSETLDQLQRANPNTRRAEELAGEALDGLNAVAVQLLNSRSDVAGAESASGLSEAMEQLAELAQQQNQVGEQTNELMSMIPQAIPQAMQQLMRLAEQQQEIADELDRMEAEGEVEGADELAGEAEDLAAMLEAARVDRETVERQEQLFRRLLDAGRTLRSEEDDEREERQSRTADPTNVALPPAGPIPPGPGPLFRFPQWDELRSLSPAQRRLVLDYFRRLNSGRP